MGTSKIGPCIFPGIPKIIIILRKRMFRNYFLKEPTYMISTNSDAYYHGKWDKSTIS